MIIRWDLPTIVNPEEINVVAPTCVAQYSKDLSTRLVIDKKSKYGVDHFLYESVKDFKDSQMISFFEKKLS